VSSPPTVSVIVPTFNRADLIGRCLRSLRGAGLPSLEIVVVDDGSTDETAAVVESFPGVIYRRQANAGPAAARNLGFSISRGRYVGFIDSDDEWIAGAPSRLVQLLDGHADVPLVFADACMGDEAAGFVSFIATYGGEAFNALPGERRAGLRVLDRRPFFHQLARRNVMFLGSLLVRREAFAAAGGFDPGLRGAADWEFFLRMAAVHRLGFAEGDPVSRYYKHAAGMSMDGDHMQEDFIRALDAVRRKRGLDADDRRHVEARLRAHVFGWAYTAYDRGHLRAARERLLWGRRLGQMKGREWAYLLATYAPRSIVTGMRRARRVLAGRSAI